VAPELGQLVLEGSVLQTLALEEQVHECAMTRSMATMVGVVESQGRGRVPLCECEIPQLRFEALPLCQGLQSQRGDD
jgi:hypothetical protein